MRYQEDRDRSAEILRLALALMGRHPAALNPAHYALWYEHCAGLNPALSRILEARLTANSALTDEDVWHLYTEHIGARDHQQYEMLCSELHRVLKDTANNARTAGEDTCRIDQAVAGHEL